MLKGRPERPEVREAWERAIAESGVTRLLFAQAHSDLVQPDPYVLSRAEVQKFLEGLRSQRLERSVLAALHFLLQKDLAPFLTNDLDELLRSSSRVSNPRPRIARGGVRGKLDARRTVELRSSGRLDEASFAVRVPEADQDTPENRLLKHLLRRVSESFRLLSRVSGSGDLLTEMEDARRAAEAALHGTYLSGVDDVARVTTMMTQRVTGRRLHRGYETAAALATRWDVMNSGSRATTLIRLLRSGWLTPVDDNDLFELYVLIRTIQILVTELGFQVRNHGLVRRGRGAVAHLVHTNLSGDESTATVYFDQTVDRFRKAAISRFPKLVRRYEGITGRARRPDIAVVLHPSGGGAHTVLVEAKRSSDESYVRQSIYKMFAYLHDFDALWTSGTPNAAKGVLVFPQPFPVRPNHPGDTDLIIASGADTERLASALRSALPGLGPSIGGDE
jgi:hypothetical protein